ncbi:hypothetical protein C0989_011538, partial [Termitomyces sp. Mn162]
IPKALKKAQRKLDEAEELTAVALDSVKERQTFHDIILAAVMGYCYWPALCDLGFGLIAQLQRALINSRPQHYKDLKDMWTALNNGQDLHNHSVEHAIYVLVSKQTIKMESLTFNTRDMQMIEFLPGWKGLTLADATEEQKMQMPVLGNGGHRLDLLRTFQYSPKLEVYKDITAQIAKIDDTGKNTRSRQPLVEELENLKKELREVTWVAKVLDLGAIFSSYKMLRVKTKIQFIRHDQCT